MTSVIHLTTVHPAQDNRIFHKEIKTLQAAGYRVALVAQHDGDAAVDSVPILPLPKPRNRLIRALGLPCRVLRIAQRQRADLYHFHDPELIPIGLLLRLLGSKVIYDVHEDLPRQVLSKAWIPSGLRKPVSRLSALLEWLASRLMDGIVAATPAIANRFPPRKTVLVQNYPRLSEFEAVPFLPYQARPMQVAYVGGITTIRGALEMVRAMAYLPGHLGARLLMAGAFSPPTLEETLARLPGWAHVRFLGWLDRKSTAAFLANSRVGIVVFHPEPNHIEAQPNKLFEYMAAGIPVIASDFPVWREIIHGVQCGLTVNPMDPAAIAKAIQWILEHPEEAEAMGRRGRQAVLERYNWSREAEKLVALYRRLCQ